MLPIVNATLFISGISTLASAIIKVWQAFDQRRERQLDRQERQLDREQEREIEEARFTHQAALAEKQRYLQEEQFRYEEKLAGSTYPELVHEDEAETLVNQVLLARLQVDAQKLMELDFDVVYERINDSYGLALTIGDYFTFAFLLTPEYPQQAPFVLLKKGPEIDEIPFSEGAWSPDVTLADVITNIVAAYRPFLPERTEQHLLDSEDLKARAEAEPLAGDDFEAEAEEPLDGDDFEAETA